MSEHDALLWMQLEGERHHQMRRVRHAYALARRLALESLRSAKYGPLRYPMQDGDCPF